MRTRSLALLLPLVLVCSLVLGEPPAQAQAEQSWTPQVMALSTHQAEVTISDVTAVEMDGTAYTIATAQVIDTDKGDLDETILIQVEGGSLADGRHVIVSHQPYLSAGDRLNVALIASPSQWAAAAVQGGQGKTVFSIVGGIDGAAAMTGELVSQADAAGDFSLTGSSFGSFPVDYYVNASGSGLAATTTRSAVQAGLRSWEDDQGSDIFFTNRGATSAKGNLGDGKNVIYWATTPNPGTTYLAQASWITNGAGTVLEFDVIFNRDYGWSSGAAAGKFDIATVMRHESGHALGLGHTNALAEVMFPNVQSGSIKGLGAGDRSGAAYLYPTQSKDPERVVVAGSIVNALESYADANGDYVVAGSGWQDSGQGLFRSFRTGYDASIRNVLAFNGHFPNGAPVDPDGRDFLIYRCKDRIGVFSATDNAQSAAWATTWWDANGCTRYPINHGYPHLTLSDAVPTADPARVAAAAEVVAGLESHAAASGNYVVSGSGWQGNGEGWFKSFRAGYDASIRNVLSFNGHFPDGMPDDPTNRDFLIYRCKDRIGVFSNTDAAVSAWWAETWWDANDCLRYPINNGYSHLTLSAPLD